MNRDKSPTSTVFAVLCALAAGCSSSSGGSSGTGGSLGNAGAGGGQGAAGGVTPTGGTPTGGTPNGGTTASGGFSGQNGGAAGTLGGHGGQGSSCPGSSVCQVGTAACDADGAPEVCVLAADGCPAWRTTEPCGPHQACSAGACACAAEPRCGQPAQEGDFCTAGDPTTFGHCAADANGCLFVAATDNACAEGQNCQVPGVVSTGTACGCPAEGPSVGKACAGAGAGATAADATDDAVLDCELVGSCLLWKVSLDCGSQHLTAATVQGANVCVCKPAPVDTVYVDPAPVSSSLLTGAPTGTAQPSACRLTSLAAAFDRLAAAPTVTRIVVQHDDFTTTTAVHLGSTGTMALPQGVHLLGGDASAPTPGRYVIDVAGAAAPGPALTLGDGASIIGFTVDASGAPGAPNAGSNITSLVACAPPVPHAATVDHVILEGQTGQTGVAITAGCTLAMIGSTVIGPDVGVALGGGSAAFSSLTVAAGDPGAGGNAFGVAATGGTATFADSIIGGAAHFTGLSLSGAADVTFTASTSGAARLASGLPATSVDPASGISVAAGAASAKLTVHGPLEVSGFASGIVVGDGTFTADGGLVITRNRGDGIELLGQTAGPTIELTGVSIHDNAAKGLVVRTVVPVTMTAATVSANGADGIDLQRTQPAALVRVAQFSLSNSMISSNAGRGVALTGQGTGTGTAAGGKVGALLSGNTIAANGGAGVYVTEAADAIDGDDTTELWFDGNDVGNNLTAPMSASGLAGGLYFATSDASTQLQLRTFSSNRVHGNGRAEIGFDLPQADGMPWNLSATADPSALCTDAAGPSYVYCYDNFPGDYAIATGSASVHVNVKGMHFQETPAIAGVDFSSTIPSTEINSFCAPQACQ